jgi:heme-degrading monooxygenase HmoA
MIARLWSGKTRAAHAETYLEYLHRTGLSEYRATPGNLGVLALRSVDAEADRAAFLLLTLWESEEAIRRFAGEDLERAVFYPEDAQYLVERDERVRHFEVVHADGLGEAVRAALAAPGR